MTLGAVLELNLTLTNFHKKEGNCDINAICCVDFLCQRPVKNICTYSRFLEIPNVHIRHSFLHPTHNVL